MLSHYCIILAIYSLALLHYYTLGDVIDVPVNTNHPIAVTYTLELDSRSIQYRCIDNNNNNNNNHWVYKSIPYSNLMNAYEFYLNASITVGTSAIGLHTVNCSNATTLLGSMDLTIIDGGTITVSYGNKVLNLSKDKDTVIDILTRDITLTCNVYNGVWETEIGDYNLQPTSNTSIIIPQFTAAESTTVKCRRRIYSVLSVHGRSTLLYSTVPTIAIRELNGTYTAIPDSATLTLITGTLRLACVSRDQTIGTWSYIANNTESSPYSLYGVMQDDTDLDKDISNIVISHGYGSINSGLYLCLTYEVYVNSTNDTLSLYTTTTPAIPITPTTSTTTIPNTTTTYSPTPNITTIPTTPSSTVGPNNSTNNINIPITSHTMQTSPINTIESTTPITTITTTTTTSSNSSIYYTTTQPMTNNSTQQIDDSGVVIGSVVPVIVIVIIIIVLLLLAVSAILYIKLKKHTYNRTKYHRQTTNNFLTNNIEIEYPINPMISDVNYTTGPRPISEITHNDDEDNTGYSQPLSIEAIKPHIDILWENNYLFLNDEYEKLGINEFRYPTDVAIQHISDGKNRFKDIYPYDRSRVQIRRATYSSDYINASLIPSFYSYDQFIATQAPKENTMMEFWQMLWQHKVSNVIMLVNVMEEGKKKCDPYLPEKIGDVISVGSIHIHMTSIKTMPLCTTRKLTVKDVKDTSGANNFEMKHFHFTAWQDKDVPQYTDTIIKFLTLVKRDRYNDSSPICVHCSAGVGRTGTCIALWNLMEAIRQNQPISVFKLVNEMREHRPHMVQSLTQYRFLYLAILELILGDTIIPASHFALSYTTCLEGIDSIYQRQYQELDYQSDKCNIKSSYEAQKTDSANKNPELSVIPYDDYLCFLQSPNWEGGEYINASYIDGNHNFVEFIATQHPTRDTARDLMQLISQCESPMVVLLATEQEYVEMGLNNSKIHYWPQAMTQHEFEGFILKNENEEIIDTLQEFTLVNLMEKTEINFCLLVSLDWTEDGEVTNYQNILRIINEIQAFKQKSSSERRPIIIHCRDGAGKTGVLISVYNAIQQIEQERRVDIFQIVKKMRFCRPHMVSNVSQYISIHSVINEYLKENTYD